MLTESESVSIGVNTPLAQPMAGKTKKFFHISCKEIFIQVTKTCQYSIHLILPLLTTGPE